MIRRLLDHWPQKLGAVLLATLVWFFVSTSQTTTTQRSLLVPLAVEGVGERRVAVGLPDLVEVTITGPSNRVDRLRAENIEAVLDLAGLQGEFQQIIDVRPPQGINLESVSPEQVIGFIEQVSSKQVPVEVVWIGEAPPDAMLRATSEPASIRVSARDEILQRVDVAVAPVPADGGEVEAILFAASAVGAPVREVTLSPAAVAVATEVMPVLVERDVAIALEAPTPPRVTAASLVTEAVVITGPPSVVEGLEQVVGRVDPETIPRDTGRYTLPVRLELPPAVHAVGAPTATVTVAIASLPE